MLGAEHIEAEMANLTVRIDEVERRIRSKAQNETSETLADIRATLADITKIVKRQQLAIEALSDWYADSAPDRQEGTRNGF